MSAAISRSHSESASTPLTMPVPRSRAPEFLRLLAIAGCVLSAIAARQFVAADASQAVDADLVALLRGIAVIKALLVLPMAGLLLWRLRESVAAPVAMGYLLSLWTVTGATVLIWRLEHIVAAALLFHAALFAFLILAFRDERILPDRLKRLAGHRAHG